METSILLVVVGLVIIIISYTISEKVLEKREGATNVAVDEAKMQEILQENEQKLHDASEKIITEKFDEEIYRVEEQLGHLSNEKIMAVSEFSDQILEKIEQNHKEVVFLYDMLNAKENEMKEFVQEIDKSKIVLEELANKELEKQKIIQHKRIQKELQKEWKKQEQIEREKMDLMKSGILQEEKEQEIAQEIVQEIVQEKPVQLETQASSLERMEKAEEEPVVQEEKKEIEPIEKNTLNVDNQNQVILELYNEGKSIMEIAKVLGKGQGEVKLVIDLFQGARK